MENNKEEGNKRGFQGLAIYVALILLISGLTTLSTHKEVGAVDTVTEVSYTTTASTDAYNFGVWSNYSGGTRVTGMADFTNQKVEVTKEAMVSGGAVWVEFKVNGKVIGWVNDQGIDESKIESKYPATTNETSGNFGIWSNYIGGTRVTGLNTYDDRQLQVTKEANVSGSTWVEFSVDGSVVGWVSKQGINKGGVLERSMNLRGNTLVNEDAIQLQWDALDKREPYTYQVYSKKPDSQEFQTISSVDLNNKVKVLNVYPAIGEEMTYTTHTGEKRTVHKGASAEKWMEEPNEYNSKGFGMGLIDVDPVSVADFNKNPTGTLIGADGKYKYDVIFFGSWDSNGSQFINYESSEVVIDFIKSGRGILLGHDTIGSAWQRPQPVNVAKENFHRLLPYMNIEKVPDEYNNVEPADLPLKYQLWGSDEVQLTKKGLLTTFPWNIGELGAEFDVPYSHTAWMMSKGDRWMKYKNVKNIGANVIPRASEYVANENPEMNAYLSTWSNTAMIQTGHSNGEATEDEQKILANTLFYLSQLTTGTELTDISAMDATAPKFKSGESTIKRVGSTVTVDFPDAEEVESLFQYYVESTGSDTGTKETSDTISVSNTSGFAGYSYVNDNSPSTVPDNSVDTTESFIETPKETGKPVYTHVVAVDKKGNKSEPIHIKLDNVKPTGEVTNNITDWTGSSVTVVVYGKDNESGVAYVESPEGGRDTRGSYTYTIDKNGSYDFKIVDNAGNETITTVNVTKIDKDKPVLKVTTTPSGWTSGNVEITAKGEDTGSGVRNVRMSTENNSKNMVTKTDIKDWHGDEVDRSSGGIRVKASQYGGFYIPESLIESNEYYVLSFDMTKLSGNIPTIGGHDHISTKTKVKIDGVEVKGDASKDVVNFWEKGVEYPNDTKKHHVEVYYYTDTTATDKNLYVQPNRYTYGKDYEVLFENIQFELGKESTSYEPNYKDLLEETNPMTITVSENGVYTFVVTDNVGNESTEDVTITNIDKTPPTLTITGNPTDYTEKDSVVLAVNGRDNQSGVKSITLPDNTVVNSNKTNYTVNANGEYKFSLTDNVGNVTTKTIKVDKIMVSYTFYLYDSKGNPVEGAGFDLIRNGNKYTDAVSDSTGLVDFGKVPADGTYTIKQTKAPDGHVVNPGEQDVEVGDETEPEEFISYPRGDVLPATGTKGWIMYISVVLMLIVGGLAVKGKKRKLTK